MRREKKRENHTKTPKIQIVRKSERLVFRSPNWFILNQRVLEGIKEQDMKERKKKSEKKMH